MTSTALGVKDLYGSQRRTSPNGPDILSIRQVLHEAYTNMQRTGSCAVSCKAVPKDVIEKFDNFMAGRLGFLSLREAKLAAESSGSTGRIYGDLKVQTIGPDECLKAQALKFEESSSTFFQAMYGLVVHLEHFFQIMDDPLKSEKYFAVLEKKINSAIALGVLSHGLYTLSVSFADWKGEFVKCGEDIKEFEEIASFFLNNCGDRASMCECIDNGTLMQRLMSVLSTIKGNSLVKRLGSLESIVIPNTAAEHFGKPITSDRFGDVEEFMRGESPKKSPKVIGYPSDGSSMDPSITKVSDPQFHIHNDFGNSMVPGIDHTSKLSVIVYDPNQGWTPIGILESLKNSGRFDKITGNLVGFRNDPNDRMDTDNTPIDACVGGSENDPLIIPVGPNGTAMMPVNFIAEINPPEDHLERVVTAFEEEITKMTIGGADIEGERVKLFIKWFGVKKDKINDHYTELAAYKTPNAGVHGDGGNGEHFDVKGYIARLYKFATDWAEKNFLKSQVVEPLEYLEMMKDSIVKFYLKSSRFSTDSKETKKNVIRNVVYNMMTLLALAGTKSDIVDITKNVVSDNAGDLQRAHLFALNGVDVLDPKFSQKHIGEFVLDIVTGQGPLKEAQVKLKISIPDTVTRKWRKIRQTIGSFDSTGFTVVQKGRASAFDIGGVNSGVQFKKALEKIVKVKVVDFEAEIAKAKAYYGAEDKFWGDVVAGVVQKDSDLVNIEYKDNASESIKKLKRYGVTDEASVDSDKKKGTMVTPAFELTSLRSAVKEIGAKNTDIKSMIKASYLLMNISNYSSWVHMVRYGIPLPVNVGFVRFPVFNCGSVSGMGDGVCFTISPTMMKGSHSDVRCNEGETGIMFGVTSTIGSPKTTNSLNVPNGYTYGVRGMNTIFFENQKDTPFSFYGPERKNDLGAPSIFSFVTSLKSRQEKSRGECAITNGIIPLCSVFSINNNIIPYKRGETTAVSMFPGAYFLGERTGMIDQFDPHDDVHNPFLEISKVNMHAGRVSQDEVSLGDIEPHRTTHTGTDIYNFGKDKEFTGPHGIFANRGPSRRYAPNGGFGPVVPGSKQYEFFTGDEKCLREHLSHNH